MRYALCFFSGDHNHFFPDIQEGKHIVEEIVKEDEDAQLPFRALGGLIVKFLSFCRGDRFLFPSPPFFQPGPDGGAMWGAIENEWIPVHSGSPGG